MKLTLTNDRTIEGSPAEIQDFLNSGGNFNLLKPFDGRDWYFSKSLGQWVLISEMNSNHLCNAILAIKRNLVDRLNHLQPKDFCSVLYEPDQVFWDLTSELKRRADKGLL